MKAEFTFFVMTSSEGRGVTNGCSAKPGLEGWRGEVGEVEACTMWMILWGEECGGEVVEVMRSR